MTDSWPESLTVNQVANRLARSSRTVRRYLAQGRLQYQRVATSAGHKYLVSAASVERLAAELQGGVLPGKVSEDGVAQQVAELTAEVAALREQVQVLAERVLLALPPARVEDPPRASWWRRLWGR